MDGLKKVTFRAVINYLLTGVVVVGFYIAIATVLNAWFKDPLPFPKGFFVHFKNKHSHCPQEQKDHWYYFKFGWDSFGLRLGYWNRERYPEVQKKVEVDKKTKIYYFIVTKIKFCGQIIKNDPKDNHYWFLCINKGKIRTDTWVAAKFKEGDQICWWYM